MKDVQGLEVSTNSPTVIESINAYIKQVLAYGNSWDAILSAKNEEPDCLMAVVLEADYHAALIDMPTVGKLLAKAKTLKDQGNRREQLYVDGFVSWLENGNLVQSFDAFLTITKEYPEDMFALKRGQLMAFCLGDSAKMLDIALKAGVACSGKEYYHGMLSFALEQHQQPKDAEEEARRALAIKKDDAWSHHALAHALYFQGRLDEGIEVLKEFSPHWEDCMSFMYTHNYFHLALFYLDKGDLQLALDLYDRRLWLSAFHEEEKAKRAEAEGQSNKSAPCFPSNDKKNMQDQFGAMDLLWKLELRNKTYPGSSEAPELPQGAFDTRWQELVGHVISNTHQHYDPLYDLLLLHTLCRTDHLEKAKEMLDSMAKSAEGTKAPERKKDLEEVWIPTGQAILHYNEGKMIEAYHLLEGIVHRMHIVGGSLEQREVLHEMYIDILMCGGDATHQAALSFLKEKIAERQCVVWFHQNLAVLDRST